MWNTCLQVTTRRSPPVLHRFKSNMLVAQVTMRHPCLFRDAPPFWHLGPGLEVSTRLRGDLEQQRHPSFIDYCSLRAMACPSPSPLKIQSRFLRFLSLQHRLNHHSHAGFVQSTTQAISARCQ